MALRLEGTGEVTVAVTPTVAFAFLADPRHAREWFAGAGFDEPPQGPPRQGITWRFERTAGTRRVLPVTMTVYEPPHRFVWETQVSRISTGNAWELRFEPAIDDSGETLLPATRVHMLIRLRPGALGWLTTLPALSLVRRTLNERAQRVVERAGDAVLDHTRNMPQRRPTYSAGKGRGTKRTRRER